MIESVSGSTIPVSGSAPTWIGSMLYANIAGTPAFCNTVGQSRSL